MDVSRETMRNKIMSDPDLPCEAGGYECQNCEDTRWVCENHRNKPWDGSSSSPNACGCGAGAPCQECCCGRCGEPNPDHLAMDGCRDPDCPEQS